MGIRYLAFYLFVLVSLFPQIRGAQLPNDDRPYTSDSLAAEKVALTGASTPLVTLTQVTLSVTHFEYFVCH